VTGARLSLAALLVAPGLLAAAPRAPLAPMVVAQVPVAGGAPAALAGETLRGDSGEGGRLVLVPPKGKPRVLTASFHSAADPEVSFDGKSILFAGKRAASDPWCVFEMKADGTAARQITCGAAGARQPVYQSTIYTITPTSVEPWVQVAFVGENPGERNEAGVAPNTSLWSCKTDGTALRRLTFNLSNDRDPAILPDGRMVYAGWLRSPGREPADRVALLGVNEDGTDYQAYAGGQGLRVKQMPAATATGLVVFVEADRIEGDGAGRLASVSQVRPLHSYRSLSGEGDGLFRAPSPLPDGRVLVAWRPRAAERGGLTPFAICRFDPATGSREKAFDEAGWHSVAAKLVAPRPMPDARSSVVRDDDPEGKLYTIDVGIQGPGEALPKGVVKSLRVVEGVPATADRPVVRRLLGEVVVADDGSYQVQIPANTPVQLSLLDASGNALRTSAWLWVRNHAAQGCVGCHEDPERTPPNRLMKALQTPAPVLHPPPEARRTLTDLRAAPPPSAAEVRAFVHSIDAGGLP
jgi:Tol biopolymer transport system component